MLKSFLAKRLSKYIKGLGSDQVSARLLSGKLQLSDVELNLEALGDLLVGALPHTVELSRVACKTVSAKVPWQAPRRHSVNVELRGVEVEIVVHRPTDEARLAAQTAAQHKQLRRVADARTQAEETIRDEAEEEQRQLRDVEAQLKVGLQNVIADGLRFSAKDIQLILRAPASKRTEVVPTATPAHAFALRLGSVSAVPCTRGGVRIDRPEDVYEIADHSVRLYRMVEVHDLKVEVETFVEPKGANSSRGSGPPAVMVEHVDEDSGPFRVWVQQQRLAGFLPNHRARRVCPFSSEAVIGIRLGRLGVHAAESHLSALVALLSDAMAPPYVPLEALPPNLAHLHWRQSMTATSQQRTEPMPRNSSQGAWAAPAQPTPSTPTSNTAGATTASMTPQQDAAAPPPRVPDGLRWTEPVLATGAAAGLEVRRQIADRRLTRASELRLHVARISVVLTASADGEGDGRESAFSALASIQDLRFARDSVFALDGFEHRCLLELGLVAPLAQSPRAVGGSTVSAAGPASPSRESNEETLAEPTPRQPDLSVNELTVGAANLRWRADDGGANSSVATALDRPLLLLEDAAKNRAVTFRWKEANTSPTPRAGESADYGWQPLEGCIHGAHVVVDPEGLAGLALFVKHSVSAAMESWTPPPFETGWCRLAVHSLRLEVPSRGLGLPGVSVEVPATLVTSMLGLGELFCGLGSIVPAPERSMPSSSAAFLGSASRATSKDGAVVGTDGPDASVGGGTEAIEPAAECPSAAAAEVGAPKGADSDGPGSWSECWAAGSAVRTNYAASLEAARGSACPCGRMVGDGGVRLGAGFVPTRERHTGRAWAVKQRCSADRDTGFVAVRSEELIELLRARVASEALVAALPRLKTLWEDAVDVDRDANSAEAVLAERPVATIAKQPDKKDKKSKKEEKKDKKDKKEKKAVHAGANSTPTSSEAAFSEGDIQEFAAKWASLHETLRRLQGEREEVRLRCAALREATAAEVRRAESRALDREQNLAARISEERLRQASLAAKAEEQRKVLDRLLRSLPPT